MPLRVVRLRDRPKTRFMDDHFIADKSVTDISTGTNPHVKSVVRKAHEELRELLRQRAAITRKIGVVKQTIVGLINLFGEGVLSDDFESAVGKSYRRGSGVTDSCRRVLMEASAPLSAREVRDLIQRTAPAVLANHKDPLATVTTVLGRLAEYGEARTAVSADGRRAWQWLAEGESDSEDGQIQQPS